LAKNIETLSLHPNKKTTSSLAQLVRASDC
jgi:hypothetical protein